jgi:hypothetical protein
MSNGTRNLALLAAAIAVVVVAIGGFAVLKLNEPETCNGIDRSVGGCDNPASFVAADCAAVGHEYGTQVNARLKAILAGPETVNDESRGVRVNHTWTSAVTGANIYLTRHRIACDGATFMTGALSEIGPEVKAGVGSAMYAGRTATYEEWLAEVTRVVTAIIDAPEPS